MKYIEWLEWSKNPPPTRGDYFADKAQQDCLQKMEGAWNFGSNFGGGEAQWIKFIKDR